MGHRDCLRRLVPELQQMGLAWRPIPISKVIAESLKDMARRPA
jgi:hypothetical protein